MALREARPHVLKQALAEALQRPEPSGTSRHARTCVVAQPMRSHTRPAVCENEHWPIRGTEFAYARLLASGPITDARAECVPGRSSAIGQHPMERGEVQGRSCCIATSRSRRTSR